MPPWGGVVAWGLLLAALNGRTLAMKQPMVFTAQAPVAAGFRATGAYPAEYTMAQPVQQAAPLLMPIYSQTLTSPASNAASIAVGPMYSSVYGVQDTSAHLQLPQPLERPQRFVQQQPAQIQQLRTMPQVDGTPLVQQRTPDATPFESQADMKAVASQFYGLGSEIASQQEAAKREHQSKEQLQQVKQENEELKEKLQRMQKERLDLAARLQAEREQHSEFAKLHKDFAGRLSTLEEQVAEALKQRDTCEGQLAAAVKQRDAYAVQLTRLHDGYQQNRQSIVQLQEQSALGERNYQAAQEQMTLAMQERELLSKNLTEQLSRVQQERSQLATAARELREQLAGVQKERNQLFESMRSAQGKISELEEQRNRLMKTQIVTQREKDALEVRLSERDQNWASHLREAKEALAALTQERDVATQQQQLVLKNILSGTQTQQHEEKAQMTALLEKLSQQDHSAQERLERLERERELQLTGAVQERDQLKKDLVKLSEQVHQAQEKLGTVQRDCNQLALHKHGVEEQLALMKAERSQLLQREEQLALMKAERSQLLQRERSMQEKLAQHEHSMDNQLAVAQQRHERLEKNLTELLDLSKQKQDLLSKNLTQQLMLVQRSRSLEQGLHEKLQACKDEYGRALDDRKQLMLRDQQYRVVLAQVSQQVTHQKTEVSRLQERLQQQGSVEQLLNASRSKEQQQRAEKQLSARLNASEANNSWLRMQLEKAMENEKHLNATRLFSSLLQSRSAKHREELERSLKASEARNQQLEELLEEERSDRKRQLKNSQQLRRERESDKVFLETSSRLLRGGQARLKGAAKELQQVREQAAMLESQLANQKKAAIAAEVRASEEERLLNVSQTKNKVLQEKVAQEISEVEKQKVEITSLQARSKRLTMLPWAELLDRCRRDVCFTLTHHVACCGGPKDVLAQRPRACDLAGRVATGSTAMPGMCAGGGPATGVVQP